MTCNMDAPEKPKLLKSKTSRKGIGKSDNLFESSTLHSPKRMDAQIAHDKQVPEPPVDLEHLSDSSFLGCWLVVEQQLLSLSPKKLLLYYSYILVTHCRCRDNDSCCWLVHYAVK